MSIFKKMFGSQNRENNDVSNNNLTENFDVKKSIFDFFKIDIKTIPDETFVMGEIETNKSGDKVFNYRKVLNYLECDIFDTIEIKSFNDNRMNIMFLSFNPQSVNLNKLKMLIDGIYLLYGTDSNGKGRYNKQDIIDYNNPEFCTLFGRFWSDTKKYDNPIMINRDENELSLMIWGVEK